MALVEVTPSDEMRVILCLSFDRCAPRDAVAKFKKDLLGRACVMRSVDATGAFDFMIEAELRDFAAYHALLDAISSEMTNLVERQEASFVCSSLVRIADLDKAVWVRCRDGRRRVDYGDIEVVRAEGDYVRLYCRDDSWLLHDTMHHMRDMLDPATFLTLHRSTIVNANFVSRLVHRDHHWIAVLCDGTEQRIAKSHVADTLAALQSDSSPRQVLSPIGERLSENQGQPTEKPMSELEIPPILL